MIYAIGLCVVGWSAILTLLWVADQLSRWWANRYEFKWKVENSRGKIVAQGREPTKQRASVAAERARQRLSV